MSIEQVRNWWENVQTSLWYIPTVLGALAFLLSFLMPEIDARVEDELTRHQRWLFFGTASAARAILSAIAGSLITVITLLFSITMLTLQQASTQYTPRIIRTFMRDRGIQIVLGVFLATFLYALLVLRQVRGEETPGGSAVPMLSVSLAIVMTVVCLGLLVFFIHHTATMFQASTIIERIHHDTLASVRELYPEEIGEQGDGDMSVETFRERQGGPASLLVRATSPGYLRRVDDGAIAGALGDRCWAIVHPRIGSYVSHGQPLVETGGGVEDSDERADQMRNAFVLDHERTLTQDDLFGVRQLVDVALKALSPSIHDPTTAEHAISCLGDILIVLAGRAIPSPTRVVADEDRGERVTLWVTRPGFDDYIQEAFGQIRRVARDNVHVTEHLLATLANLSGHVDGDRALAVQREIARVDRQVAAAGFDPEEEARLRSLASEADGRLGA